MRLILFILLSSGVIAAYAKPMRMGHPHVHGEAKVDIGIDGNNASVTFNIDTHSLLGFEHTARTVAEKKRIEIMYQLFRKNIGQMIKFPKNAGCSFSERKLKIVAEESGAHAEHSHAVGESEHQSLIGDYDVRCAEAVGAALLDIDLKSFFSDIHGVHVQIVTDTGSKAADLPGAGKIQL